MEYIIRKAVLADSKSLNNLLTMLIHDEKKYDSNINGDFVVNDFYENMIIKDSNVAFVCEINNVIVGYVYGYIIDSDDTYIIKTAKLDALYVVKEYRNKGIATSLINEFNKWAKSNNVKSIEVQVLNNNISAFNLYHKVGFSDFKTTLVINDKEID